MVKPGSKEKSKLSKERRVLTKMIAKVGEGTVALGAGALQGGRTVALGAEAVQGAREAVALRSGRWWGRAVALGARAVREAGGYIGREDTVSLRLASVSSCVSCLRVVYKGGEEERNQA